MTERMRRSRTAQLRWGGLLALVAAGALGGCLSAEAPKKAPEAERAPASVAPTDPSSVATPVAASAAPPAKQEAPGRMGGKGAGKLRTMRTLAGLAAEVAGDKAEAKDEGGGPGGSGGESAPTRSWFPETFLFEPLVVTDPKGEAQVSVRVPDRLTTWRVLALAHSRAGAQAGATAKLLGTLPVYVDPVVPPFLRVGDVVQLPLQVVNTTREPFAGALSVEAEGLGVDPGQLSVEVPPLGTHVVHVTLRAGPPGPASLRVRLGKTDAVVRRLEVQPTGRPVQLSRSGTLAAPRTLELEAPTKAEPGTHRVRVLVFPGALALLRNELAVSLSRPGVAEDAYALKLVGEAPRLLAALGEKADRDGLRRVRILAGQRVVRHARTFEPTNGPLLAEAALAHPESPVLARLGARLVDSLLSSQRPDGTFGGGSGWSLQRVLVSTAESVRLARAAADLSASAGATFPAPAKGQREARSAIPTAATDPSLERDLAMRRRRARAVSVRAAGAFERHAKRIEDAYTAAAVVASGAVSGSLREALLRKVRDAVKKRDDGSRHVPVERGTVRADGTPASELEATALAVLALTGGTAGESQPAPTGRQLLADLGATLLAGYQPGRGWGDGRTNHACLLAVLRLFRDPLPEQIRISVTLDGQVLLEGQLDRKRSREVLALEAAAPGAAGKHRWEIRAEPPVAGLGYALALSSHVPHDRDGAVAGLELQLQTGPVARAAPGAPTGEVGQPLQVQLRAAAPAGLPLQIRHVLAAGVQVDTPSLEALVRAGKLTRFETADGVLALFAPALAPGQVLDLSYRVIPTMAGTLHAPASTLSVGSGAGKTTTYLPAPPLVIR